MSTWHLALRWLGLRDRADRKALPKTPGYYLLILAGCVIGPVAGVLFAERHWLVGAVLLAIGIALAVGAEILRDLPYLREQRTRPGVPSPDRHERP